VLVCDGCKTAIDLRLTTSLPRPNLRTKNYCSLINFGLHHYQPTQWLLTNIYTSLPAPMYIHAHCLFRLLFLSIISTAYHVLSGSRAARLLLNWLIDWLNSIQMQDNINERHKIWAESLLFMTDCLYRSIHGEACDFHSPQPTWRSGHFNEDVLKVIATAPL